MDRQMEMIIKCQQEYEHMKCMPLSAILAEQDGCGITDDHLPDRAASEIRGVYKKKREEKDFQKNTVKLVVACADLLFCVILLWFGYSLVDRDNAYNAYEATPMRHAEKAIDSGDYDRAEKIIEDGLEENPDNFFLYITYADLYIAQGRNDDAVKVLVDTIYDRLQVQNITSTGSYLYQKLKEIPKYSLEKYQEDYQDCLADCEVYIGKYAEMKRFIKQGSYYSALLICDELKTEGAYDNYLCDYYFKCYSGLKAYDQCAEYFLGLYGKQQGITDFRYPSDEQIRSCLDKIKANVSPELAAQIEALE